MKLDPFYLIVDSADWIEQLVPLGVRLVQLRMKDVDDATLRQHIRRARQCCADHGCQLIVNDFWQIAIDEACDFVHLGQEDLMSADLRAIRGAGLRLGLSTHDEGELNAARDAEPDYVALGPVYPTILKKMAWAPQGLERLTSWKGQIAPLPLVAIGGLRPDRLQGVFQAGADSAAVVTDITLHANPEQRTREWLRTTEQWR
ncbi:MAG: thiamine phosphate synthase [Alphaproteobacteria bacterium]|nr:thiamine phosphate synthase [Alphaproteobacteria bacterium]